MASAIRKDVIKIALLFKSEMVKAGKGFKFAKAKDITKTYHYRWFKSFLDKCYSSDLDFDGSSEVCKAVVKYAKDNKLLNSGASLLCRGDIIDICIKNLENEVLDFVDKLELIKNHAKILLDNNSYDKLIRRNNRHSDCNIVSLRCSGKLDDSVIAISKTCMKIVSEIGSDDMLSIREYYIIRMKMKNKYGDDRLRDILGDDYNG